MSLLSPDFARRIRQYRFNPISSLSPESLSRAINSFDAGQLRQAALLWEAIEDRDDVLQIVGPKRRKKVSGLPWEVLETSDTPEAAKHAEAITDFLNSLTVTDASDRNVRGGLRLAVRQMMNAVFHKYAVHEIVWSNAGGKVRAELRYVPLYFFSNVSGRLSFIGAEGAMNEGPELQDGEWMVTTGDSALMKAASICYVFKRLSLQDWLAFSEKFGIPGIHGECQAAKGSQEWNDFCNALSAFANEWVTATNSGAKINLIEAKSGGDAPFAPMVERMDRRMASLVLGSDLATLSRENSVGSQAQQGDAGALLEDDCELISETLQTQLVRPLIAFLFGTEPLAYVKFMVPQDADTKAEVEVDQFLINNGGELDAAETFERYNRTPAKTMAEGAVLKKAAAPATPPATAPTVDTPTMPTAENDKPTTVNPENAGLVRNAVAKAIGVRAQVLAPVADVFREIEAMAADGTVSDSAILDATEKLALRMPEFFTPENIAPLADEMEAALGTSTLAGVIAAFRKHPAALAAKKTAQA